MSMGGGGGSNARFNEFKRFITHICKDNITVHDCHVKQVFKNRNGDSCLRRQI